MQYNQPYDQPSLPNAGFVNGNPGTGIAGSIPPAAQMEFPQREIVNALAAASLTPINGDLTQLAQAMSIGLWLGAMGGSANAIADVLPTLATTSDGITQYAIPALAVGMTFHGIIPATNTGPATLTLTGFGTPPGAKPIFRRDGTPVQPGDLIGGATVSWRWDGTGYRIVGMAPSDVSTAFIIGADTGTAGALKIATPIPTVAAPTRWMTLVTTPAAVNTGPTTLTLGGVTGQVIYPNGLSLLGGEMQPRPQVFIYDVAGNWEWQGQQAPVLQQATNFYVNGSTSNVTTNGITYGPGSDGNNGQSAATPFATIARAISIVAVLNANGKQVTINVADGTYAPFGLGSVINGGLQIVGDPANPSACIIASSAGTSCVVALGATFTINGFRIVNTSTSGDCVGILSRAGGNVTFLNMDFGPCNTASNNAHLWSDVGFIQCAGNYKISGGATFHWRGNQGTFILSPSFANTVTLVGTPAFSAFVQPTDVAFMRVYSPITTFSGSATGSRYQIGANSVIETNGSGMTFLPGSTAGSSGNGGIYV